MDIHFIFIKTDVGAAFTSALRIIAAIFHLYAGHGLRRVGGLATLTADGTSGERFRVSTGNRLSSLILLPAVRTPANAGSQKSPENALPPVRDMLKRLKTARPAGNDLNPQHPTA